MKKAAMAAVVCSAILVTGHALADGNVNFVVGQSKLSDGAWDRVGLDSQPAFGVNVDFAAADWPVRLVGGLNLSADSEEVGPVDVTAAVAEISFGVLWRPLKAKPVHPYVGAGLSSVGVVVDDDFDDDSDQSFGMYLNGGVYWRLGSRFNIGADVRILRGTDIEVLGSDFDADNERFGLLLGFGW